MATPSEAVDPTPIVTLPTEPIQIDPAKIHGLGAFTSNDPDQQGRICWLTPNAKVFLVHNKSTVEVRTDAELAKLFAQSTAGLVYVTAFPNRAIMGRFLGEIAWETEVWLADAPSHMIHLDGCRFLGPYKEPAPTK